MSAHPQPVAVPTLDELAQDYVRAYNLPRAVAIELLAKCSLVHSILLVAASTPAPAVPLKSDPPDEYLDVNEAAAIPHVTPKYLYRKSGEYPFVAHLGRGKGSLRFSRNGIDRYMRGQR